MKQTRTKQIVVAVAELKAQLSEYLRMVKAGREVVVTERGRAIATIAPLRGVRESESRLELLLRSGAARAPTRAVPIEEWRRARPSDPQGRSLQILLEERATDR